MGYTNDNKSFLITSVRSYDAPDMEADMVVFQSKIPYLSHEDAEKHVYYSIKYSKRYCVYTVTERFIRDNYLTQCIISPKGEIIGYQSATHLNLTYRGIVNNDDTINIIRTPLANFFLAVDTDIYHPEVTKIAASMGANVIIASRYTESFDDLPYRIQISSEKAAVSNNLFVFDVTQEGARLFKPKRKCNEMNNASLPESDTLFKVNLGEIPARSPYKVDNGLIKKYLNILER